MSEEQNIEQTDSILSETSADWRSGLPQDIADHSAIKDIKSVEDLAKSTINAQQMLGGRVAIPSSDATKEEWDTFYGKIGRPEEIGGYETPQENMPQELTPEFDQALKVEAHRLGLTKGQYAGLARYMSQTAHATAEGQTQWLLNVNQSLKRFFGSGSVRLTTRTLDSHAVHCNALAEKSL